MMTQTYIVADNAFAVSAPDDLRGWRDIAPRFAPFAADAAEPLVLAVDVTVGPLPSPEVPWTYEPEYNGIMFIIARAAVLPDGALLMEFGHVDEPDPRLRMRLNASHDHAEILFDPGDNANDKYYLTHAIMLAYMIATLERGTLMIHASSVLWRGRAYLFMGKSGTGKSTHASLWLRHIEGTELLNDDHPILRITPEGEARAYGSPWSGKTDCYRNLSAPVGAFVRIVRDADNHLVRLAPLQSYASLTASVFFLPILSARLRDVRHAVVERLAMTVPCCEMHCRPDAEAARVCSEALH